MYNTAAAQKLISSTKFNKSKERLYSILELNIALFGHTNDRETTSYKQQFTFKKRFKLITYTKFTKID